MYAPLRGDLPGAGRVHCPLELVVSLSFRVVRLMEHNVDTAEDCIGIEQNKRCIPEEPKDFLIPRNKHKYIHGNYNVYYKDFDIAIVKLPNRIEFNSE